MRWILLALGGLVVWVAVRWVLRVSGGVGQARERAFESLRRVVPGATGIEREPGLVVLTSADDRLELDTTPVLKAALAHKGGGPELDAALRPVVEAACVAQTEPDQMQDERDEARSVLGDRAAHLSDGQVLRALFGHAGEDARDAALHSALENPTAPDPQSEETR